MSYIRNIEDIVLALERAKEKKINVNLLIGAGCSVTAGVPTANGIVEIIKEKYPREFERANCKDYNTCMSKLTPSERKKLITELVDSAKINWAHIAIAQLMKTGYINRILTTNFDNLIQKACSFVYEFPAIYDLASTNFLRTDMSYNKSVLYLHGQYTGFILCNTKQEVELQAGKFKELFHKLNQNSLWIVVGYSGENDATFSLLAKEDTFEHRLFWIGHKDNKQRLAELEKKILGEYRYAFYVNGYDADDFFVKLTRRLDIFPPYFISHPFSCLKKNLDEIKSYSMTDDEFLMPKDINSATKDTIEEAIKTIENDNVKMAKHYINMGLRSSIIPLLEKSSSEEVKQILQLLTDDVSIVAKQRINELEDKGDEIINDNENLMEYTNYLRFMAATEKEDSEKYLKKVCESYLKGSRVNELNKAILREWGESLIEFVEVSDKKEIKSEYCSKYLDSIKNYLYNNEVDLEDELYSSINNLAYSLIMGNEFDVSKELLNLLFSFQLENMYHYATMGLWHFRNEDISESIAEKNGKMYYEKAIDIIAFDGNVGTDNELDEELKNALVQKYYYELSRFFLNRKDDRQKAIQLCNQAYEIGAVKISYEIYLDIIELMKELDILLDSYIETASTEEE